MKTLGQLAVILGAAYAGHLLMALLSAPLPSSVLGMLLLLAALRTGLITEERLGGAAQFLLANMAFFFLPSAVEIIDTAGVARPVLFRLLAVCVLSAAATFFAAYGTVCLLQKLTAKKKG